MYKFFVLTFRMGITHCPEISDYWSGSMLCSGPKCFTPLVMSRCRYQSILKLRFSDPSLAKRNTPLSQLGQYMALLMEVCQLLVDPGETISDSTSKTNVHILSRNYSVCALVQKNYEATLGISLYIQEKICTKSEIILTQNVYKFQNV